MRKFFAGLLLMAAAGCGHHVESGQGKRPPEQSGKPAVVEISPGRRGEPLVDERLGRSPEEIEAQIKEKVRKRIPAGTPIKEAKVLLEKDGFACSFERDEGSGVPFLYCDYRDNGWPVFRRTQASVYYEAGRVTRVKVSTGLIGP
jgi:hypothetical protein